MITKGVIVDIIEDTNLFKVNIPVLRSASDIEDKILKCTLSYQPGNLESYTIGDIVFVGFENDELSKPIILGKLYTGLENELQQKIGHSYNSSLTVFDDAILPENTKINNLNIYDKIVELSTKTDDIELSIQSIDCKGMLLSFTAEETSIKEFKYIADKLLEADITKPIYLHNFIVNDDTNIISSCVISSVKVSNTYRTFRGMFAHNDITYILQMTASINEPNLKYMLKPDLQVVNFGGYTIKTTETENSTMSAINRLVTMINQNKIYKTDNYIHFEFALYNFKFDSISSSRDNYVNMRLVSEIETPTSKIYILVGECIKSYSSAPYTKNIIELTLEVPNKGVTVLKYKYYNSLQLLMTSITNYKADSQQNLSHDANGNLKWVDL